MTAELPLVLVESPDRIVGFMCLRKNDFNMFSTGFSSLNLRSMFHLIVVPGEYSMAL